MSMNMSMDMNMDMYMCVVQHVACAQIDDCRANVWYDRLCRGCSAVTVWAEGLRPRTLHIYYVELIFNALLVPGSRLEGGH